MSQVWDLETTVTIERFRADEAERRLQQAMEAR